VSTPQDILEEYMDIAAKEDRKLETKNNDISTRNPVEEKILDILDTNGSISVEEIIGQLNIETPKITAAISTMEIYGKIKHMGDGIYRRAKI
jgi:predicted Rossmann fold nucleotide-binding protein DprA/Smf involved in DNA uptake